MDLKHEVQVMVLLPKPQSSLQDELGVAVHHWFLIMRRFGASRLKMLTEAEQQQLPHTLLLCPIHSISHSVAEQLSVTTQWYPVCP